jgi:uncharacterized RDD family membrane protein YckC
MTPAEFDPSSPQYGYPSANPPPWARAQQPGGLGLRFLARLIDGLVVNIVAFFLSQFLFDRDSLFLATSLFSGVLMFSYFVVSEITYGSSAGKKMLGLAVHGPGGAPKPDAKQSAIRNAFTLLAVVPYVGGLLALVAYIVIAATISSSPTKQGKHDQLAGGTQVVKT